MANVQHTCTGCVPIDASILETYIALINANNSATAAAERAEYAAEHAIGKSPYIGENGNWWEWSDEQGAFIDTMVQAHSSIAVDTQLDPNSTNPVQNKVTTQALAGKQDAITDLPAIRSGAAAGATAYQKPASGVPASDMASGVQTSLGKADTAYQKPSDGVPKTDLAPGIQTSLERADESAVRPYNAQSPNGMGYLVLEKDKTFASQVTATNTIYEIRYDFDLGGNTLNLPANCVLQFNGGCLHNGIINGNNTSINEDVTYKIFDNVTPKNFAFSVFDIRWVGAIPDVNTDSAPYFQKAMDMCEFYQSLPIRVIGKYTISSTVTCRNHFQLFGNNFVARAFAEALPAYKTSIISVSANTVAFLVSGIQATGGMTYCSFNVHNILFTGAERASTTLFKITTTGAPSRPCLFHQCEAVNFNKVFDIAILDNGNGTMVSHWTINENNIFGNNSFISTGVTAEATLLNMSIYNNVIEQQYSDAITLYNPVGYFKFENNLIESNVGFAISIPSTTRQCHFDIVGNYLEGTKPFLSILNDNNTSASNKVTLNSRDNYFYQGTVSTYQVVLQNVIVDSLDDGQYLDTTSSFNGCYFSKTANIQSIPISCLGEFNAFEELPEFDCGEFVTTPFRNSGLTIHNVVNGRIVNRKDVFGTSSLSTYAFTPATGTAEGDIAIAMFYCGLSGLMNIDFNFGVSNNKNYGFPRPGFALVKRAYPASGNNNVSVTPYISTTNEYAYYSCCVTIAQLKSHPEVTKVGDLSVGKNMLVNSSVPLPSVENAGLIATIANSKRIMWMGNAWKNLDGTALS